MTAQPPTGSLQLQSNLNKKPIFSWKINTWMHRMQSELRKNNKKIPQYLSLIHIKSKRAI